MNQNNSGWGTDILERAKTAKPYTEEESNIYDGDEDPARILATLKKLADEQEAKKEKAELLNSPGYTDSTKKPLVGQSKN